MDHLTTTAEARIGGGRSRSTAPPFGRERERERELLKRKRMGEGLIGRGGVGLA